MRAFPISYQWNGEYEGNNGMDLRDYFAAQAMKYMGLPTKVYGGRIGNDQWNLGDSEDFPYELMAIVAYRWADAMMKVREQ